jgi:hypothetical protein
LADDRNKQDGPAEIEARMQAALKRALATPPKPRKPQAELKLGKRIDSKTVRKPKSRP